MSRNGAIYQRPFVILQHVVPRLIKQGKPAVRSNTSQCMYRGADGAKCAIGHCIPDELYREEMENKGVNALSFDFPTEFDAIFGREVNMDFLSALQCAHDNTARRDSHGYMETLKKGVVHVMRSKLGCMEDEAESRWNSWVNAAKELA